MISLAESPQGGMPRPAGSGDPCVMRTVGKQTSSSRTFWWNRTRRADAGVRPLRAVIFDLDGAVADLDHDGELATREGLIDLVMNLFVEGVWVGVVSSGRRSWTEPLVRQLVGDGLVETIVTVDDLDDPSDGQAADLYALALWELGIGPESALAVTGSAAGLRAAADSGLATVVVPTRRSAGHDFTGTDFSRAAAVITDYDSDDLMSASSCLRLHHRFWTVQHKPAA